MNNKIKVIIIIVCAVIVLAVATYFGCGYCITVEKKLEKAQNTISSMESDAIAMQDEIKSMQGEIESMQNEITTKQTELDKSAKIAQSLQDELDAAKKDIDDKENKILELEKELNNTLQELNSAKEQISYLDKHSEAHNGWPMCWRETNLEQWEIDFFAKLLHSEAGIMGYEGQFWVASAILNLSELTGMSIWDMGHKVNMFAVAPIVDNAKPTQQQYNIIYEVLNNGWIADVAYFRTDYPHSFGNFMIQIENVCFSSP